MGTVLTPEFLSMVVGIIVSLLIALVPQFEPIKTELVAVVAVLVGLVVAAFGSERVAAARSSGMTSAERLSTSAYKVTAKSVDVKSP